MYENIMPLSPKYIFVLSESEIGQAQCRFIFCQFFIVNWNVCRGLWTEGHKVFTRCILLNRPNEGPKTKVAFKGSFKLRRPLTELDDMSAEICKPY